ncbi:MAG: hypothetical protein H0U10_04205 [Chloroflexia bacterium]|nr:hypothetical protein [Chloroflexia bacterium]
MAELGRRSPDWDGEVLEQEAAMRDLGGRLGFPPTPDLAGSVRARLEAGTPVRPRPRQRSRLVPWPVSVAAIAATVLLLTVGGLLLVPEAGLAVADRLGLRGVVIRFVAAVPTAEPAPIGGGLLLGERVSLGAARAEAPFPLRVPEAVGFDSPVEVYRSVGDNAAVSFVYPAGPSLPPSAHAGVGAVLTQFRAELEPGLVEKGVGVGKTAGAGTTIEAVNVGGNAGYWIDGASHGFFYRDPVGEVRQEEYRLAGNVLLWEDGEVTLRLESALTKAEALAVAVSTLDEE